MSDIQVRAIIAGILFGAWPLIYQKGAMHWGIGQLIMSAVTLVVIVPAVFANGVPPISIKWAYVVAAGIVVTIGLVVFNGGLQKVTAQEVSSYFVLMIVVQIVVPAVYHVIENGQVSGTKIAGFVLAIAAAFCLV